MAVDRKIWPAVAVIIVVAVAAGIYFSIDPSISALFPKCPFKSVTGLQCPGCGSQRAIHALLHGDIAGAIGFNALLVASIPVLGVMIPVQFMRHSRPRLYRRVFSTPVVWTTFIIVIIWWLGRNILGW